MGDRSLRLGVSVVKFRNGLSFNLIGGESGAAQFEGYAG